MGVWHVVCVWAYKSFASEHLTHKIENQNPFQVLPKTGQKKQFAVVGQQHLCAFSQNFYTERKTLRVISYFYDFYGVLNQNQMFILRYYLFSVYTKRKIEQ